MCKENDGPTRCNAIYCDSIVIETGKFALPGCIPNIVLIRRRYRHIIMFCGFRFPGVGFVLLCFAICIRKCICFANRDVQLKMHRKTYQKPTFACGPCRPGLVINTKSFFENLKSVQTRTFCRFFGYAVFSSHSKLSVFL